MRSTQPLFRVDPGWLFVVAGMVIAAAGILTPAQEKLRELHRQRDALLEQGHVTSLRLAATSDLLERFEAGDEAFLRRLAASQLNLVPADTRPILRSTAPPGMMSDWVDDSLHYERPVVLVRRESMLSRLTNGPRRLWVLGFGVLCVFFGLLIDPALTAIRHGLLKMTRRQAGHTAARAVAFETACSAVRRSRSAQDEDDLDDVSDAMDRAVADELRSAAGGVEPEDLTDVDPADATTEFDESESEDTEEEEAEDEDEENEEEGEDDLDSEDDDAEEDDEEEDEEEEEEEGEEGDEEEEEEEEGEYEEDEDADDEEDEEEEETE